MCIRDSYVYQKGVLCFLIHEGYVRSVKQYCFVRKYAAVPVQFKLLFSIIIIIIVIIIIIIIIIIISCFLYKTELMEAFWELLYTMTL